VAAALQALGLVGLLARRSTLAVALSLGVMLLGVVLTLAACGHWHGTQAGQAAALLALAVGSVPIGCLLGVAAAARRSGSLAELPEPGETPLRSPRTPLAGSSDD
jgi:NADH:ubiquinone oxidoreductase subunit K